MTPAATPEALVERKALRKAILAAIPENVPLRGRYATAIMEQAVGPALATATATAEAASLRAERDARQAADDALLLSNDGELEADPQKQIAHLQLSCREFIREREEWKASAKAEWATADRLRAEVEAKDRRIALADRVKAQLEVAQNALCKIDRGGKPMREIAGRALLDIAMVPYPEKEG